MIFQSMLTLQKRFCLIDSPIPFQLVCNPFGTFDLRNENHEFIGDREDINGTDICNRPAGAWLFDIWKLLPEKYMKENPAFKMAICYDDTKLSEGQSVSINYSDVNLGEGVAGVNGQDVQDIETHNLLSVINAEVSKFSKSNSIFSTPLYTVQVSQLNDIFNSMELGDIKYFNGLIEVDYSNKTYDFNGEFVFIKLKYQGTRMFIVPYNTTYNGYNLCFAVVGGSSINCVLNIGGNYTELNSVSSVVCIGVLS